jgi:O-antigen/teichoic acid export membrane protein
MRKYINNNYASALLSAYSLSAFSIVIQFLLVPLYIKYLGKRDFGILMIVIAATNYAAIGIGWLSGNSAKMLATHWVSGNNKKFRSIYICAKLLFVGYAAALSIICLALIFVLPKTDISVNDSIIMMLACLNLILSYEYSTDRLALVAAQQQVIANILDIFGAVIIAIGVISILVNGYGLISVMLCFTGSAVMVRFAAWLVWRKKGIEFNWPTSAELKKFGNEVSNSTGRDYLLFGVIQLSLQADALFIGWYAGPDAAASYYLVWRLPEIFILLMSKIPDVYSPYLIAARTTKPINELRNINRRGIHLMIGGAVVIALLYALFGESLVTMWVGDSAPQGSSSYFVCALAMFFIISSRWPTMAAYWLNKTRPLLLIAGLELVCKIFLMSILLSQHVFYAPAAATVIVHVGVTFYLYMWLGKQVTVSNQKNQ